MGRQQGRKEPPQTWCPFSDVLRVFEDPRAAEFVDEEHSSAAETRYAVIGLAGPGLLYVVFTEPQPGVMRILHARRADKRMVRIYEGKGE